jgi:hypothetical protein
MELKNAVDWQLASSILLADLDFVGYNQDLMRLHNNIGGMVNDLSKVEVVARQHRNPNYNAEQLKNVNEAIKHLESLLLIARLMK